jgi:hypothetical protein
MEMKHPITIGCCGFAAAQEKYFAGFAAIEIQQTFYQLQTAQYFRLHWIGGDRHQFTDENLSKLVDWCQAAPTWPCLTTRRRSMALAVS